jgi:hypothetical protein
MAAAPRRYGGLDQAPAGVAARDADRIQFTSLNPDAIACLILEFVDLTTWSKQVAAILASDIVSGVRPWPYFTDEYKTWA